MRMAWATLVCAVAVGARADEPEPSKYLAKDGTLKAKLDITVYDCVGGIAGSCRGSWAVEGGEWVARSTKPGVPDRKGKFAKEQLASLAKDLERYDLEQLEGKQPAKLPPGANVSIVVKWGDRQATLIVPGTALPKTDAKTLEGRYGGLVQLVQDQIKAAQKK